MAWLYSFESKEIQKFIMRSDKLRDMVGGSELINQLCDDYLLASLKGLGIDSSKQSIIAQAAGWARIVFDERMDAEKIYKAWPLLVNRFAPGLQMIQSMVEIVNGLPEAINECSKELRARRNSFSATLPEVGPLVERAPRTGLPAVGIDKKDKKDNYFDRQSERKQAYADSYSLIDKLTGGETKKAVWPNDIAKISGRERSYVAIVHADGNDLGKCLIEIGGYLKKQPEAAGKIYAGFSRAIDEATVHAAQAAYRQVLQKDCEENKRDFIAARPIVLGGDDLTIIVRADLAVAFTETFLAEFEACSEKALSKHLGCFALPQIPKRLTACAGIAFVKQSFPFSSGYELAESLCSYTKKAAKLQKSEQGETPASFAFHKVATSLTDSYDEVVENELSHDGHVLAFAPYCIGSGNNHLPKLNDLKELIKVLGELPSGTVRTLISTIYSDLSKAENEFNRILQIAGKKKKELLVNALSNLTENKGNPLWDARQRTPLKDAYDLRELMGIKDAKEGSVDAEG